MCKFCDNFDFSRIGIDYDNFGSRIKAHIYHAGGSSFAPEEQRFLFCPICGKRIPSKYQMEPTNGVRLDSSIINELYELRKDGCSDSDIEDFISDHRLSRKEAGEVWLQIAIWNAPECCKPCKHVQLYRSDYPCTYCSRPLADMYEERADEAIAKK